MAHSFVVDECAIGSRFRASLDRGSAEACDAVDLFAAGGNGWEWIAWPD